MTTETVLLWLLCAVVTVPLLCVLVGRWLADWWFGRTPGGRK